MVGLAMRVISCPRCGYESVPGKRLPSDPPIYCLTGPIGNPCGERLLEVPKKPRVVKEVLERDVLRAARKWLAFQKDVFVERINVTRFGPDGERRYQTARKGSADLHLVVGGRALYVELKRPGGKQRPEQMAYQRKVEASGAVYVLEDSLNLATLKAAVALLRNGGGR